MVATVSRSFFDEVNQVCARLGFASPPADPTTAESETARVPLTRLSARLSELQHERGDSAIGLRIGRLLNPRAFGITGYLAMAGPTLHESLPRVDRYQRLVVDGIALHFDTAGTDGTEPLVDLQLDFRGAERNRLLSDLLVSGARSFGAWVLGTAPPLHSVRFHYPPPADTSLHLEIFGTVPAFAAGHDGFSLAAHWFHRPVRAGVRSIVGMLEAKAAMLMERFDEESFTCLVSETIAERLAHEEVTVTAIATRLGLSPRTLQRRLHSCGFTFNTVLRQTRIDLANRLLADASLSIREVTGLLGYKEPSAFCHAYRQWTGRPPSAARSEVTRY